MEPQVNPSTTPSPPKQKRAPRHKAGGKGKEFKPTDDQRKLVEGMCAYGIPHEDIARLITNPETKSHISSTTLRAHFREEIDTGLTKANTKVIGAMFKNATTPTKAFPGGIPVIQIFWAKARMGWQGAPDELPPPGVPPDKRTALEIVRRIAFLLHQAGRAQRPPVTIEQVEGKVPA